MSHLNRSGESSLLDRRSTRSITSTPSNKPRPQSTPSSCLWRFHHRSSSILFHLFLACLTLYLTSLTLTTAAPAIHLGSSSNNGKILIWPDQIEDNALAEQNGDFVYKKATAAEKQEQKSSGSIFFWPSSQGGSHHNHHHRSSRNASNPIHNHNISSNVTLLSFALLSCALMHFLYKR